MLFSQNERGTLVLDLLKDEKSTTVKETIELDSLEGVEVRFLRGFAARE